MGKNRKLKQIRKLATELPEILTDKKQVTIVLGQQMIDEGYTELNGEPVEPGALYHKETPAPLNHEKEMKALYLKHGYKGVQAYLKSVDNVLKELEAKNGQA